MTDVKIREELNRLAAVLADAKDELLDTDAGERGRQRGCAHVLESLGGECFALAERIREGARE